MAPSTVRGHQNLESDQSHRCKRLLQESGRNPRQLLRCKVVTPRNLVLVVDDDPSILQGVARLLRVRGIEAELFCSGEDFLNRADSRAAVCLVLDIHLTGMSGIELTRRLMLSGSTLPVIFITADDGEATRKAAAEAGCVACLSKPFPSQSLVDAIETAFARQR